MRVNKQFIRSITSICAVVVVFASCFLITVSAADVQDNFSLSVNYRIWDDARDLTYGEYSGMKDNGSVFVEEIRSNDSTVDYSVHTSFRVNVEGSNSRVIIRAGTSFDFCVDNIFIELFLNDNSFQWDDYSKTAKLIYLYFSDGSSQIIDTGINWFYDSSRGTHNVSRSITASKDIVRIEYFEYINLYRWTGFFGYADQIVVASGLPLYVSIRDNSLDNALGDINNNINNVITGTPEQNQQVQDSVGGLNSSTDKLGQLGDQMSSVDKPTVDSNKISADSLVPHTALVTLSSPFLALWENNQLLAMLTIVVTLVLVSWVFFGKKG